MILKLKQRFYESVKNKSKIATTRINDKGLSKGDFVTLVFTDDGRLEGKQTIPAIIEEIEKIKFGKITLSHAESENHGDVISFKRTLKEFYPNLTDNDEVYYIKFKIQSE